MVRMLCVLAVFRLAAAAAPEKLHAAAELPDGWEKLGEPVVDEHLITVRLSLQQQNIDELHRTVLRVSDPRSTAYGQYLTGAEVTQLTAPAAEHVSLVQDWLSRAGVEVTPETHGEIQATMTTRVAAELFKCKFHRVVNKQTSQQAVQAQDYWLPADIEMAVAAVYGLHGLPLPPRQFQPSAGPAKVTPSVIASTYSITGVKPSGSAKNIQAVAEFQGQTYKKSDLVTFFSKFVSDAPSSASQVHKNVGKHPTGTGGVEASLDLDYIMGVAPSLLTEFWYWGGNDFCGDLKSWSGHIIKCTADCPLVHSVSYGWQGELSKIGCKTAKVTDVDANFAKIAAMGITIVFASGDSGSGYAPESGLDVNPKKAKIYPSWPASSPWLTAVGSTRFINQKVGQPEMATDQFGSGGGFSTLFPAFKDQVAAVKNYLSIAQGLPPAGDFPAGGRATPDVSALGEGFQVVANGEVESVGGTSASAPTFAALVSLLNEARIKAGKPAMGYLNPFLYQNPDAFTDITVGSDKIGRGGEKLKYGYDCAKGWDPVTGLGTPIFTKMLAAAMKTSTAPLTDVPTEIVV
jgi:tripeptidyl-peptidase-1